MKNVQNFLKDKENQKKFLQDLFELIKIPSITTSAKNDYESENMTRCAEKLKTYLESAGASASLIFYKDFPPFVYAEKIFSDKLPTVLVYGHYDVMPVSEQLEKKEWKTPPNPDGQIDPFYPVIMETLDSEVIDISELSDEVIEKCKIWARSADDDKGQSFMHIAALKAMSETNFLHDKCNIKFLLEGQEESGSEGLTEWCETSEAKDKLKADVILVSDTSLLGMDSPSLTCGLRGVLSTFVTVSGPKSDLHSGLFGGVVANPINTLCKIIGSLVDEYGRITIPGFYNGIIDHTFTARDQINSAPFSEYEFRMSVYCDKYKNVAENCVYADTNIHDKKENCQKCKHFNSKINKILTGEVGYSVLERKGTRPTLDVCYINGGANSNIIPKEAKAKISMRLVNGQSYQEIAELFKKHIESIAPPTVNVEVEIQNGGLNYSAQRESKAYKAAEKALKTTFNKPEDSLIIPYYSGGSIPIIAILEKTCGTNTPAVLMGFGLDSDTIHGPNENYPLKNFFLGMQTIPYFYEYFCSESV